MKTRVIICAVILMVLVTANAQAGWLPDYYLSTAQMAYSGPEAVTLLCVPDGSGDALTEARLTAGNLVDATITVTLVDGAGVPVSGYPYEDIYLASIEPGFVACTGGANADHNTDALGMTTFTGPFKAGGHSESGCRVLINGAPLVGSDLNLHFVSPDINGDLQVNLSDVGLFSSVYIEAAANHQNIPWVDLNPDGIINLSDVGVLMAGLGTVCP